MDLVYVEKSCVSADQVLRPGDVVLTMSSGSAALVGKSALVKAMSEPTTFGAFCGCVRATEPSDASWIYWFAQTDHYRRLITASAQGTNINNLKRQDLEGLAIPFPPPDVQRHIVARIEELFVELDDGEIALATARADLETYRGSLLKAAVTGELTADWRAANPLQETGDRLRESTLAERRGRWEGDTRGRGPQRTQPHRHPDDTPSSLPRSWAVADLESLSVERPRNGLSIKESSNPTSVRGLRLDALSDAGVVWDRFRYLPKELSEVIGYTLRTGDLLVSRANGSPRFVGRASMVLTPPPDMIFPDTAIRYRLGDDPVVREWITFAWASPVARQQLLQLAKSTAGILKVSQDDIRQVKLPIPPRAEMATAVGLIRMALVAYSDLKEAAGSHLQLSANLRQSILASAFRGDLVQ